MNVLRICLDVSTPRAVLCSYTIRVSALLWGSVKTPKDHINVVVVSVSQEMVEIVQVGYTWHKSILSHSEALCCHLLG